ncbi:Glycerate dehydrogenase [Pyrenophora tritici-repentis]|nr:Glycerate dehydrogenase [Pyrenophora tritici-repentis]
MHHEIVALEAQHQPLPIAGFDFPPTVTYSLTTYDSTRTREELLARIRNATIIIVTIVKIDAEALDPSVTPNLRYIAVSATGTDLIDLDACRARGIRVTNCPGANLDAVSEHALSLYFAARRRTVLLDRITRTQPSEWKSKGSVNHYMRLPDGTPPITCKDEVMGVIGYGGLGTFIPIWVWVPELMGDRQEDSGSRSSYGHACPDRESQDARCPFAERRPPSTEHG